MPTTFVVQGVQARRLEPRDLSDMFALHQDPAAMAMLGGVRDRASTEGYMASNLAHWQRWGFGIYRLGNHPDGHLVGRAGLRHVTIEGEDEIEVAYALCPSYWGRGLAVAVTLKLISAAEACGLRDSIVAFALTHHVRSRRVMEKAGFVFERGFDYAGSPHVLYRRALSTTSQPQ